jgi:hypothetical protein
MITPPNNDRDAGLAPAKPKRKRSRGGSRPKKAENPESDRDLIDRLLRTPVALSLNGQPKSIPAIEAIVYQLQRHEISGDPRASRILLGLRKLARKPENKKIQIVFVEGQNANADSITSTEGDRG